MGFDASCSPHVTQKVMIAEPCAQFRVGGSLLPKRVEGLFQVLGRFEISLPGPWVSQGSLLRSAGPQALVAKSSTKPAAGPASSSAFRARSAGTLCQDCGQGFRLGVGVYRAGLRESFHRPSSSWNPKPETLTSDEV